MSAPSSQRDRLFGTYRAQPCAGHEEMTIRIHGHRDPREVARLRGMSLLPFRGDADGHTIDRRDCQPLTA